MLKPIRKCNLCGGEVEYVSNEVVYGRRYGSGFCYRCRSCGAYVGTHEPRPLEPYGILADDEMRALRKRLHSMFDETWRSGRLKRKESYLLLSKALGIPKEQCHFGMFDKRMLARSLEILADKDWYLEYGKEKTC